MRQAMEVPISLGLKESIGNYILALPVMSLGCMGSVVAQTHMPDTAEFLRSNPVRPKSAKPHDEKGGRWKLRMIAPLRRAGIPHQAIFFVKWLRISDSNSVIR